MSRRHRARDDRELLPITERELLDAEDVGRLLGVSRSQIFEWSRRAMMPESITFSRACVRWRRREVVDWVLSGCPPRDAWCWLPTTRVNLDEWVEFQNNQLSSLREECTRLQAMIDAGAKFTNVHVEPRR